MDHLSLANRARKAVILSVFLVVTSCVYGRQTQMHSLQRFVVEGQIDTVPNAVYFVTYRENDVFSSDTISLDNEGRFTLVGEGQEPIHIAMAVPNIYDETLLDDDFIFYSFWVDPGKVTRFRGLKGSRNQKVDNSITDNLSAQYLSERKKLIDKHATYRQNSESMQDNSDLSNTPSLREEIEDLEIAYIKANPDNYHSIIALKWLLKATNQYELGKELYDMMDGALKSTGAGKSTLQHLDKMATLVRGQKLPAFEVKDTNGNSVALTDFRGKYVLIDFWASWCVPCRRDHPALVALYNQYRKHGFEILGVSLDDSESDWLNAIKDDGLKWPQVSDLDKLGFKGRLPQKFNLTSIPDNFLLDRDGVIMDSGLRVGKLETVLKELFE